MTTTEAVPREMRLLHPLSVPLRVLAYVKGLIWPFVLLLIFSQGDKWELLAGVFVVPLAAWELVRYFTTSYGIAQDRLIVREGVLRRSERQIPLARVQNIDLVQNLLQRVFHVAEVQIHTASGAEPEAVLRVLSSQEVERLRRQVFAGSSANAEAAQASATVAASNGLAMSSDGLPDAAARGSSAVELLRLSPGQLIRVGLVANRGLAVVGVAFGLAWQFDLLERIVDMWGQQQQAFQLHGWRLVLTVSALAVAAVLLIFLLSMIWALVVLFDYRLTRDGEDLRIECGLLTRHSATIPRHRIQFVSVRENVMHRLLRSVSVSVETAGGSGDSDDVPVNRRWVLPLVHRNVLPGLMAELQPDSPLLGVDWLRVSPRARGRLLRRAGLLAVLGTAAAAVGGGWWGLAACPVLLVLLGGHAVLAARSFRYGWNERGLCYRSGVWTVRSSGARFDRLQVAELEQSPFDRRHRMATVAVDTAGAGPAGHRIRIRFLDDGPARELEQLVVEQMAATAFRW